MLWELEPSEAALARIVVGLLISGAIAFVVGGGLAALIILNVKKMTPGKLGVMILAGLAVFLVATVSVWGRLYSQITRFTVQNGSMELSFPFPLRNVHLTTEEIQSVHVERRSGRRGSISYYLVFHTADGRTLEGIIHDPSGIPSAAQQFQEATGKNVEIR